jgi:hypothetical protein
MTNTQPDQLIASFTLELTIEELKIVHMALLTEQMNLNKEMDSHRPAIRDYATTCSLKLQPVALRVDRLLFSNI